MDKEVFINGKSLSSLKIAELKVELAKRNLPKTGNKLELYNRLRACLTGGDEGPSVSEVRLNFFKIVLLFQESNSKTALINGESIEKLTVPQLKAELKKRNLPVDGLKCALCTRLQNYLAEYGKEVDMDAMFSGVVRLFLVYKRRFRHVKSIFS